MKFSGFKKSSLRRSPEEYIAGIINADVHRIIAIAGAAGSGKTTLGKNLKRLLPRAVTMVNIDDYFACDLVTRMRERISGYDWNSRKKSLFLRQMEKLRQGENILKPVFSYKTQSIKKEKEKIVPEENIIVEGTLDFSEVADFIIFTWAPEDVLINRVVKRGGFKTVFKNRKALRKHFEEISIVNYRNLLLPHIQRADIIFDTLNSEVLKRT
ncbi:MAG: AAA family ATPase [Parcubacteria group bacterium]|jgi:uridine kinase